MGLSQHQLYTGFLAWFGIVPLLYVLLHQKTYKSIFKISFLWGLIYNFIVLFWIAMNIGTNVWIAILTMFISVVIMSFNIVLICMIWFRISQSFPQFKLVIFPIIWAAIEFVRSYGILGFPWTSIANSQLDYLYLIQNSEITGIYGISFWLVMLNILVYQIFFENQNKKYMFFAFGIFIFPWIFGYYLYFKTDVIVNDSSLSVTLIQPNINLADKRNFNFKEDNLEKLINQSNVAIKNGSQLIIWPESAVPFHRLQFASQRKRIIERLFKNNDASLLSGNIIKEISDTYNSSILFDKHGIKGTYHKRQPVPLAEHVPLSSIFSDLKMLNIGSSNFSKGKEDVLFNINDISFTGMICFESTFPEINRRHVNKGADALVYLVNDGWYETEPEPTQHARQAVYRAIENRRPVIRCANTGISMIVNEKGEIVKKIPLNSSGSLSTKIAKNNYQTFYTRFGNVFALILLAISGIFLLMTFIKNEKN